MADSVHELIRSVNGAVPPATMRLLDNIAVAHDARVTELLAANTALVEQCRSFKSLLAVADDIAARAVQLAGDFAAKWQATRP